jgi:hypothetical protein
MLPAGLRRLPLRRLDVGGARITVDQLVGHWRGDESKGAGGDDASDASDDSRNQVGWSNTLRRLVVTADQFFEPRAFSGKCGARVHFPGRAQGECLRSFKRLEALRIAAWTSTRDWNGGTGSSRLTALSLARMLSGVARLATLVRLELLGCAVENFLPLVALPQLEVLVLVLSRSYGIHIGPEPPVQLPSPMPNLRALALPLNTPPPWPAYPALEQLACSGSVRLPPLAEHLRTCAVGGRLRWLSIASYHWLPTRTVTEMLAAHPSLEVVEVGRQAAADKNARESTVWRFDARHLADCLATWTGHEMANLPTADIRQWAASGPVVTAKSLLDD